MKIILASKSERRKELLKQIVPEFDIIEPDIEEISDDGIDPAQLAILNARLKAIDVVRKIDIKDCLIISADTIVAVNNIILGKPDTYDTAFRYLKILSGTFHKVITGCCVFVPSENKIITNFDISFVKFKNLTDRQIKDFLDKHSFYDKAGGYAIQEVQDDFVEEIRGSFDNVVGFPVELVKRMLVEIEQLKEVEIIDIAFPNSSGIGKYNGKTIFVENAVPGDIVYFYPRKNKTSFSYAENCGIKKYSNLRTEPVCIHFGNCGGCCFQNLGYESQIEFKKKYLIETLTRIGRVKNFEAEPIVPSPEIYYYRNKMEFAFGLNNRKIVLGLRERQSPLRKYTARVNGINSCSIFFDSVGKIFQFFIQYATENNLVPYNPYTKEGFLRHLVIRYGRRTNQIMIMLITKSGLKINLKDLASSIASQIPEIVSFWHIENDMISDVVSFQKKHLISGIPFIEEKIGNFKFRIYPETFFQPNTAGAEKLYDIIYSIASEIKHQKILGLFCGSGPIEITLSKIAMELTGIDNNKTNIETATENCIDNGITNCAFQCLSAEEFLKKIEKTSNFYDVIVVDPPRGGLSNKAISYIIKIKPEFVIYVSCNPATLARDIAIFNENGYLLRKVVPIDLFPHTTHLESCCLLERAKHHFSIITSEAGHSLP